MAVSSSDSGTSPSQVGQVGLRSLKKYLPPGRGWVSRAHRLSRRVNQFPLRGVTDDPKKEAPMWVAAGYSVLRNNIDQRPVNPNASLACISPAKVRGRRPLS